MKIYTGTGDTGETSLLGGQRVMKDHQRLHAYGALDEVNSYLGLVRSHLKAPDLNVYFGKIQGEILCIGSHLAAANPENRSQLPDLDQNAAQEAEQWIDKLESELPPLKNFILPGGGTSASHLQVLRTLVRRAERQVIALHSEEPVDAIILIFLNRLSDLFFVSARYCNQKENITEDPWNTK